MASEKEFAEGIRSYRTRLETELECLKRNLDEFNDADHWKTKKLINDYRRAIEKCNMYLSSMEEINEKSQRNNDQSAGSTERDGASI